MSVNELKSAVGLKTKINGENNTITLEFKMPENSIVSHPKNEFINFVFDNKEYSVKTFKDILVTVVKEIGIENVYNDFKLLVQKEIGVTLVTTSEEHDVVYKNYFKNKNLSTIQVEDYYLYTNYSGSSCIVVADRIATNFGKIFQVDYNFPEDLVWTKERFFAHLKKLKLSQQYSLQNN